jgi:ABC-2 type transport system permease protein
MAVELEFEKKPRALLAISDSLIMIRRSSMHIIRNTDQLLGTFFQPIMFLVLFTAVFGGAIATSGGSYINFLMAGILVQTIAFGSTTTAIAVTNDLQKGIVDRFRSLPMSNVAVLNGHVVSDLFRNGISAIVMVLAGLVIGFRPTATFTEWLMVIGLVALFTLSISWLSAIVGVVAKSVEGVQWLTFVVIFPLTFASSAFVDPSTMTSWLRVFAENQPVTHMVNAVRSLLVGTPMNDSGLWAVVWSVAILVVSVPLAAWLFRRKTTS